MNIVGLIDQKEKIETLLIEKANFLSKIFFSEHNRYYYSETSLNNDKSMVTIVFEEYCCGDVNIKLIELPVDIYNLENNVQFFKHYAEEQKLKKEEEIKLKREQEKKEREDEEERRDRKLFETLKKRFEPDEITFQRS